MSKDRVDVSMRYGGTKPQATYAVQRKLTATTVPY